VSSLRTALYEPDLRGTLDALMARVWGRAMPAAEFDWWFERNPRGRSRIVLALEEGRAVAVAAATPIRIRIDGEERDSQMAVNLATDPDHRGRSLFTTLMGELDLETALTFPTEAAARVLEGKLGWRPLPGPRVWAGLAPTRPVGAFESARELPGNQIVREPADLAWRYAESPRRYRLAAGGVVGRWKGVPVLLERFGRAPAGFVPTPRRLRVLAKGLDGEWSFSPGDSDFL